MESERLKRTRLISVLLLTVFVAAGCFAAGCSSALPDTTTDTAGPSDAAYATQEMSAAGADIALVGSNETLDGSFAQAALGAIGKFAGEEGLSSGVYRADGGDVDSLLANIELAAKGGAQLVVLAGADLASGAARAQQEYPDISFVLLGMGSGVEPDTNGVRVIFSPEQGGWLAGYAAVWEGYASIGWLQSEDEFARRETFGYLLGAQAAAQDMDLADASVMATAGRADAQGTQGGTGETARDTDWRQVTDALYGQGVELVFANVAAAQDEVLRAAQTANGMMIALGGEDEGAKAQVLVRVKYDPAPILTSLLEGWRSGRFVGGGEAVATVGNGGVGLDLTTGELERLDSGVYEGLVDRFRYGTLATDLARALAAGGDENLPLSAEPWLSALQLAPPEPPDDSSGPEGVASGTSAG